MKRSICTRHISALLLAGSTLLALNHVQAAAAEAMPDHAGEHAAGEAVHGKGVVTSIDAAANTVTLKHDAIPQINWPAMTMPFKVSGDAEEQVEVGDTVEFEMTGSGDTYTISKMEKAE